MNKSCIGGIVLLGMLFTATVAAEEGPRTPESPDAPAEPELERGVEERLERVERIVESRALRRMSSQIDALRREVQELRGTTEELEHRLERQSGRMSDLYNDLDRRMVDIERRSRRAAPKTSDTPLVDTDDGGEREAYREAFELLRELRYEDAVDAFKQFLDKHPEGRYAHTARYWLAEGEYAQRHFERAIEHYQAVLEHHPDSPRAAEAYLKIAYSHDELGNRDEARRVAEELISTYPETTEANQAERLLRAIREAEQTEQPEAAEEDNGAGDAGA
jgi:tol-pal system protein YbgF